MQSNFISLESLEKQRVAYFNVINRFFSFVNTHARIIIIYSKLNVNIYDTVQK